MPATASLTHEGEAEKASTDVPPDPDPNLIQAMKSMTDNIVAVIDAKISTVLEAIDNQSSKIQSIVQRVQEAENRIDVTETTCTANETKIQLLEKRVRDLTEQVDDLENRGRRCNVRIIGLPEDTEGSNPVRFFEKWIPDYLQVDTKAGKLKLERGHRSLAPKPAQGGHPRPVIVRFHNFQDKQRVMTAATKLFTLNSKQTSSPRDADALKISFFNDYSAAVVQKRRAFNEVKTPLRELQMEYALLYPATLSVKVGRARKKFVSPEEVISFLDSRQGLE
ncbi:LINE-1 type transposase domain-containing 1 [Labeo rohita]|uniref:LINE-1 type transposase domain-containing 1 n=1 Tax=Labeo rohita TaxID=84645 RepID=A0A498LW86_LABRO|nr:LINE-1 type transposase domain-containing 1 [Labeo rohita]RXN11436.1 LINE-1 type transposase domain-containing 1 [Labeo rohita]